MFKTARFKVHNPSRHKAAMLFYAMKHYHLTLKSVLETALTDPDLPAKMSALDKKGVLRFNAYKTSHYLYSLAPKGWALAPLRDYLIGDAAAMLLSHFKKIEKAKNKSNPPTLRSLRPPSAQDISAATGEFVQTIGFPLKPQQLERIEQEQADGHTRIAARLNKIYSSWAATKAAGRMLRSLEPVLPHPVEFTRPEFGRGFLLARNGEEFYLLVRLFAKGHRYWKKNILSPDFISWPDRIPLGGKPYPGLILPLELGREHHEREYLEHGRPQSAKLVIKPAESGGLRVAHDRAVEFYAHIAFEFEPAPIETETILGIDRGAVMIGAGTVIKNDGAVVPIALDLHGHAFASEMARLRQRIAEEQRKGHRRKKIFRLRRRRADIVIGEYANRVICAAIQHKAQIAIEKIDKYSMNRFLTQSQFGKLQSALEYKAARAGLPKPIEVPAARTSQTCPRCAHWCAENRPKRDAEGKPIQDLFLCVTCAHSANADQNASHVIALRALHQQLNGGKFRKFAEFQQWLKELVGRDGQAASPQSAQ